MRARAWDLQRIETLDGSIEPVTGAPEGVPSLLFTDESRGAGLSLEMDGGCNRGGGRYRADPDGRLALSFEGGRLIMRERDGG